MAVQLKMATLYFR